MVGGRASLIILQEMTLIIVSHIRWEDILGHLEINDLTILPHGRWKDILDHLANPEA
jgi:hypothetical protein